jgi:predicted MFS family arabinose efflux permease
VTSRLPILPADIQRNFLLDATAAVLVGVFVAATSTFTPVVARRLGASDFQVSLVTAAPFAGNLFALLAVRFLQGRRKLPFMVGAWTLARALFLLMAVITTSVPFVLITIVFWIIVSLPVPAYAEVMRQIYPDAYRGRAMAYVRIGMTASLTLATPLAGQMLDRVGYQWVFPVAALFGVVSSVVFGRIRFSESLSEERRTIGGILSVLRTDRAFRGLQTAFFVYGFGNLMLAPLVPILLVDELRLNYSEVGLLGLVNAVFWMLGYFAFGRAVDRRGAYWTLQLTFLMTAAVPFALVLAGDMSLVAIAYMFAGLATAGMDLGWLTAIIALADRDRVGDYTALHSFLVGIRGLTAPFFAVALLAVPGVGLRGGLVVSALLIVAGWLVFRAIPRPSPEQHK